MGAVEIKNLCKTFNGISAIDNLTLTIPKGKITGIIGADAAGKTTLIRIITGLLCPTEGDVSTLGFSPVKDKTLLDAEIGYMPQKFGLYEDLTVIENLKLYADLKNVEHNFWQMLEFTNLGNFQDRLAGKLSGGMKQKLGLACALLGNPKLLILDEPTVGVDPISRHDLMNLVKNSIQKNTTVIWSTAYLDEAQNFDEAVIMDKGRVIYQGLPSELSSDAKEFENKVIELMGGHEEKESLIAKKYELKTYDIEYPVEANNLCKKYGDFYAVKNNSFKIKKGEIFGLLGPNGAGKSTSFKMMCGLSTPSAGTARIMGIDIVKNPSAARANLGYMAQKFSLYGELTVRENLDFFAGIYGISILERKKRVNEIINIFALKQYSERKSSELPTGFKQRLSLAAALIFEPPILFLDEPTSGVDIIARRDFWNHIKSLAKKGVTVLVTTHFMDEAEFCDRISLFYKGETIAIGTPEELKEQAGASNMQDAFVEIIKRSEL